MHMCVITKPKSTEGKNWKILKDKHTIPQTFFSSACATFTKIDRMLELFQESVPQGEKRGGGNVLDIRDITNQCSWNLGRIWFKKEKL